MRLFFIFFIIIINTNTQAQQPPLVAIETLQAAYEFRVGMQNYFQVVAQQNSPVALSQISAREWVPNSTRIDSFERLEVTGATGNFVVQPTRVGVVEVMVTVGDTTITKRIKVRSFRATINVGNKMGGGLHTMGTGAIKVQRGLKAPIINEDISAFCKVLQYNLLRVGKDGSTETVFNKGGVFEAPAKALIRKAQVGDQYIFYKASCQCYGATSGQWLEPLHIEVK